MKYMEYQKVVVNHLQPKFSVMNKFIAYFLHILCYNLLEMKYITFFT